MDLFGVLTHEFDDDMRLKVEFLYGQNEVPEWWTSPSYPPQLDFDTRTDTGRYVYADHPGLAAMAALTPAQLYGDDAEPGLINPFATFVGDGTGNACPDNDAEDCRRLLFYGRPLGSSGPTEKRGSREHETTRFVFGLEGELDSGVDYTTSVILTQADGKRFSYDAISERWSEAMEGYGICGRDSGGTKGADNCQYYNPFSNAIRVSQQKFASYTEANPNPHYPNADNGLDATPGAGIVNSQELYEWMTVAVGTEVESSLMVWDGILSGEADNGVGWAFGAQYREEEYKVSPNYWTNLQLNPCQSEAENKEFRDSGRIYNANGKNCAGADGIHGGANAADDYAGSGPFTFLAGSTPFDETKDITAIFGEVNIPFTENVETQLSIRYEDYGGQVGDTIDPKVAVRWQATDRIVVRSSASSTFRGPTLNQLGGRTTALSFLNAAGTFKAVDAIGNPDLEPEKADTFNTGILFADDSIWQSDDSFSLSLDYWRFDFEDPIIRENFNAIAGDVFRDDAYNAGSAYTDRVFCGQSLCTSANSSAGAISRIETRIINGPDMKTDGLDLAASFGMPAIGGDMEFTLKWTHIASFDVGASHLGEGFDANGKINDTVSFLRPIVSNKAKLGVKYVRDAHILNFVTNYTDSYQDADEIAGTPLTAIFGPNIRRDVEDHTTFDLHYNLSLANLNDSLEDSAVWVSIYNLTDENPPRTRTDLNYDPYTHNPFGQMIKVGVRHKF